MAVEIAIPKLGLTMTEATLVKWNVPAGGRVEVKQIVCIIETDKVSLEMEVPAAGWLHPVVEAGRRVAVGEVIGYVAVDEAELTDLQECYPAAIDRPEAAAPPMAEASAPAQPAAAPAAATRQKASPAARKLSASLGIDLTTLAGSGPGGRIVLADVERAGAATTPTSYDIDTGSAVGDHLNTAEKVAIQGIRKIIARNMTLSLNRQAQLTLHTETSATALVATREAFNARLDREEVPVSFNAILVQATARALRRHPRLNASVEGREIHIWEQIHIGVAMDPGTGLLVPVIRRADTKSLRTLAAELADLTDRAQNRRLLPDELQGGTFTITNLGRWGIDHFTPINNYPQSAILGVGRIVEKPWVRDGAVVAEPRLSLSLTIDHRIIDGVLGARFLKTLTEMLEEPRLML